MFHKIRQWLHSSRLDACGPSPLSAYFIYDRQVKNLFPVSETAPPLKSEFVHPPGMFQVDGNTFHLNNDGIYRFYRLPDLSEQRIVCQNGLESLLRMVGYLWHYGNLHDSWHQDYVYHALCHRCVTLSCGPLARLTCRLLAQCGWQARPVTLLTLQTWNSQDNGHTLVEIFHPEMQIWFLYDPSFHRLFSLKNKRLNALELCQSISYQTISLEQLPGHQGHTIFATANYSYDFWIEHRTLSDQNLYAWYQRVAQLPLVWHKKQWIYPKELAVSIRQRLTAVYPDFRPMPLLQFQRVFYDIQSLT